MNKRYDPQIWQDIFEWAKLGLENGIKLTPLYFSLLEPEMGTASRFSPHGWMKGGCFIFVYCNAPTRSFIW